MTLPFVQSLLRDRFLHLLLIIACVLSAIVPFVPASWPAAIDWHTIVTLSGLMLLTKGIELSGYFDVLGRKMARRFVTERQLAIFMVLAAALLSTFLTNDVALFIVVPLTLTLKKVVRHPGEPADYFRSVGGERRLAADADRQPAEYFAVGTIRPLFLRVYRSDAASGSGDDADPAGAVLVLFSGEAAQLPEQRQGAVMATQASSGAVWDSYVVFLDGAGDESGPVGLALVLLGFLVLARAVIVHVDWSLLLVFMVMFIDVHLLTQLPALHQVLSGVGTLSGGGLWLTAIGLSQVISNVPSTILLLNYVPPSILLAWAVNVGGFGLLPGSLANIIALRMASDRRIWWRFHLYSIPMLLWAALSGYWLFQTLRLISTESRHHSHRSPGSPFGAIFFCPAHRNRSRPLLTFSLSRYMTSHYV